MLDQRPPPADRANAQNPFPKAMKLKLKGFEAMGGFEATKGFEAMTGSEPMKKYREDRQTASCWRPVEV